MRSIWGMRVSMAAVWTMRSAMAWRGVVRAPEKALRWVSKAGTARLRKRQFFVSSALVHEHVGFEEVGDGVWSLPFYDVELARLDERDFKLRP